MEDAGYVFPERMCNITGGAVKCDTVLMYEITSDIYGAWSKRWCDVIESPRSIGRVNLLLYFIKAVYPNQSSSYDWYIETVYGKFGTIYSYRIWVPVPIKSKGAYINNLNRLQKFSYIPEDMYGKEVSASKRRIATPELAYQNLQNQNILCKVVRDYIGVSGFDSINSSLSYCLHPKYEHDDARPVKRRKATGSTYVYRAPARSDLSDGLSDDDSSDGDEFVRSVLNYGAVFDPFSRFERMRDDYVANGVECNIADYVVRGSGNTYSFVMPDSIRLGKNIRIRQVLTTDNILMSPNTILKFHLPDRERVDDMISCNQDMRSLLENSQGKRVGANETVYVIQDVDVIKGLFDKCYEKIHNVKCAFGDMIDNARSEPEVDYIMDMMSKQFKTLYSAKTKGVPPVFHAVIEEFFDVKNGYPNMINMLKTPKNRLNLSQKTALDTFFYNPNDPVYRRKTHFGITISKVMDALLSYQLMPPQIKAVFFLYTMSFTTCANNVEANICVVLIGPKNVGKSEAGRVWLSLMPTSMQQPVDNCTSKVNTYYSEHHDNKYKFVDDDSKRGYGREESEIQSQTADSNGILVSFRLEKVDGRHVPVYEYVPQRACKCINMNDDIRSAPRVSRDVTIHVPQYRTKKGETNPSTATLNDRSSQIEVRKMGSKQAIKISSCAPSLFWGFEAMNGFHVDTQMLKVFKMLLDRYTSIELDPRTMNGIKTGSVSCMVRDLTARWWQNTANIENALDTKEEVKFYRRESYLKMEHIILAANLYIETSTSSDVKHAVIKSMRSAVTTSGSLRREDNVKLNMSYAGGGDYYGTDYTLDEFKNKLVSDTSTMGDKVILKYFEGICAGVIDDVPNIKISADNLRRVQFSMRYLNHTLIKSDYVIMGVLERRVRSGRKLDVTGKVGVGKGFVLPQKISNVFIQCDKTKSNHFSGMEEIDACDIRWFTIVASRFKSPSVTGDHTALVYEENVRRRTIRRYITPESKHCGDVKHDEKNMPYVDAMCADETILNTYIINERLMLEFLSNNTRRVDMKRLYRMCLSVAGGYESKKLVVGFNQSFTKCDVMTHVDMPSDWSVSIGNPDYWAKPGSNDVDEAESSCESDDEDNGGISDNLFLNTVCEDSTEPPCGASSDIFDTSVRTFTWSSGSNLEDRIRRRWQHPPSSSGL
jgi:hypothetical protein